MARSNSSSTSSSGMAAEVSLLSKPTSSSSSILTSSQGRVDPALVERAVQALLKYHDDQQQQAKKKQLLLGNHVALQVQFGLLVGPQRPSLKPIAIALPHAICKMVNGGKEEESDINNSNDIDNSNDNDDDGLDEAEVCFIVKEDSKAMVQEMIAQFPQYLANVKKVLGLESLRKKHSSPTQRRALCAKYTLFLCDDRILPNMTQALGKEFIKTKKLPIPVDMRRPAAIPLAIYKSLRCTFLHLRDGATCLSIVAGSTGMRSKNKLVDNVLAICEQAVLKMPRQWANVQSIALATPQCTHGLPVYNKIPAELQEISLMAGLEPIWKLQKDIDAEMADNDDDDDDNEKKKHEGQRKRKELAAKSPLVRALKQQKKQKKMETKPVQQDVEEALEAKATASKSKTSEHAEKPTGSAISTKSDKKKDKESVTAKSVTEKELTAAAASLNAASKTPQNTPIKRGEDESKTTKSSKKEKKEEKAASSSKKRKNSIDKHADQGKDEASPEKKSRTNSTGGEKTEAKPFHAAKEFAGSKKGYVFRSGAQGLGYYVDVKPVVDKLAIAALLRMGSAKQQQHGGGGGGGKRSSSSSGKGKRRSGGGGSGGRR